MSDQISRREFLARAGAGAACLAAMGLPAFASEEKRPNIVFILTDDQRYDSMGCTGHPYVHTPNMDRLAKEGAIFRNAFVTTSLCSPSRGSFLTGKYVHTHGVKDNRTFFPTDTQAIFPALLQKAGYETGYFGKWHMWRQDTKQPGFNRWVAMLGQGTYMDPKLNIDGTWTDTTGYVTDLLTNYAVDWLKQKRDKPFCMYLAHKAVHEPFTPAARHTKLYEKAELPLPASSKDNMEGKPEFIRKKSPLAKGEPFPTFPDRFQERVRDYNRTLTGADDSVGRVLKTLEEMGELDNTIIIFAGDNGFFQGEHGLGDKRWAYEESMRIPFLVRFPKMLKAGSEVDEMVLNIDLAPTLLDLAGVPIPSDMQGRSWKPLLQGKHPKWREDFLYEYFIDAEYPNAVPVIKGVRTTRWKYISYPEIHDVEELYDLKNDPQEMHNLALDPKHADVLNDMKVRLARLLKETGASGG
jgi:arylsulfatase A-like enzyme